MNCSFTDKTKRVQVLDTIIILMQKKQQVGGGYSSLMRTALKKQISHNIIE
jgi:hypothetical protein